MKKFFAILLTLSLALTALMLPAMAEETATDSTTRNITAQGPGRNGQNGPMNNNRNSQNGQAPDFSQAPNGQNGQNGQAPDFSQAPNGQNSQNGQAPDFSQAPNDQNGQNGQAPDFSQAPNGQNGQAPDFSQAPNGQAPDGQNGPMGGLSFDSLLKDGIIDQDTYDAIVAYMKENAPAAPETNNTDTADTDESTATDAADSTLPQGKPGDGKMPPEKPADDNGTTPPEKPADDNGTTPPEKPADDNGTTPPEKPADGSPESDLLKKLVENGILTQEQADAILTEIGTSSDASTSTDTDEVVYG